MPQLEFAGEQLALRDPNPRYADLIAASEAHVANLAQDGPGILASHQYSHAQLWTADDGGIPWSQPESLRARMIRDRHLGKLAGSEGAGDIVLDLGCGTPTSSHHMQEFIKPYGPRAYVGVNHLGSDHYRPWTDIDDFGTVIPHVAGAVLPGAFIHGDMLAVASRLPSRSMHVLLNGIDKYIVNPTTPYGRAMATEIRRIVPRGGLVWGVAVHSGLLSTLAEDTRHFDTAFIPLPVRPKNALEAMAVREPDDDKAGYYFLTKRRTWF